MKIIYVDMGKASLVDGGVVVPSADPKIGPVLKEVRKLEVTGEEVAIFSAISRELIISKGPGKDKKVFVLGTRKPANVSADIATFLSLG